jgi:SHS2 domain-containing protein
MPSRYEILDHTADLLIKARGNTLAEAFENAAYAMFDTIVDLDEVKPVGEIHVNTKSANLEQLLVDWLSELLFICDAQNLVFSDFKVTLSGTELHSVVKGEEINRKRHTLRKEIKAVTYHMLEVNEKENCVQVLFDI